MHLRFLHWATCRCGPICVLQLPSLSSTALAPAAFAGLAACAALAAYYPFMPTHLVYLLGLAVVLGAVSSVAFSTSYQLVAWFRSASSTVGSRVQGAGLKGCAVCMLCAAGPECWYLQTGLLYRVHRVLSPASTMFANGLAGLRMLSLLERLTTPPLEVGLTISTPLVDACSAVLCSSASAYLRRCTQQPPLPLLALNSTLTSCYPLVLLQVC